MLQPQGKLAENVFWLPPQDGGKIGAFKKQSGEKKKKVKGPLQGSGHISSSLSEGSLEFRTRGCMSVSPKTLFPKLGEDYGEP